MTVTIICDECGRLSEHELFYSGHHEQIYTDQPYPKDWESVLRIGGGELSPKLDYCPACWAERKT